MIQAYNNIDTSRQKSRQDDIFSRLYPFSATCATSKIHQISKFLVTVSPSKVKTKKAWLKPKLLCIHSYYSRLCQLLPPWRQSSSGTSDSGWQAGCSRSILVNLLTCVIPGQGNSKILNLIKKSGSFDTPSFYKYQTMRKQVRATLFDPSLLIDRLSMKSDVPMTCLFWRYNKWRNRILDLFSILNNHEKLKSRWAWSCWHPWPQRCNLRAFPGDPQGEPKAVVDKPEDGIDVSDSSVEKIYAYHIKCLP